MFGAKRQPAPRVTDEGLARLEALRVAQTMQDTHDTATLLKNAHRIRDWIVAGQAGEPRSVR